MKPSLSKITAKAGNAACRVAFYVWAFGVFLTVFALGAALLIIDLATPRRS